MSIIWLLIAFLVTVFSLGLPLAALFLLYKIYTKLKEIEEQLQKTPRPSKQEWT